MRSKVAKGTMLVGVALLISGLPNVVSAGHIKPNPKAVAGGLSAVANQLNLKPEDVVDYTKVSGEYCFNAHVRSKEGGHMIHYASDPAKTQEDVIVFINAERLIKAGVVNVEKLPRFPGKLGAMTLNQWYYLPAGELEPHHNETFKFPMLIKASSIK
jgi:hypothetical protein